MRRSHPSPRSPRRGSPWALAALAALALLVAGPALAQAADEQPTARFGEEVEVTEVLLDVLVTDRDGNVIVGLEPDDFVVEEDGEAVEITGLSFYSNRRLVDPVAETSVPADRHFVLFFHDQSRGGGEARTRLVRRQLEAARGAKQWLQEGMTGGDWVAVVRYDVKLEVYADFTQNRGELRDAIDAAIRGRDPELQWPSRRPDPGEGEPSLLAGLPAGEELGEATENMYDALTVLAGALDPYPGRKNVLLFTAGFGELDGFVFGSEPDRRYYPTTQRALNDANVAVYPVDLVEPGVQHAQIDFLQQLADDTGAKLWDRVVNFATPLRLISEENSGYNLLAYRSAHPAGESGFQRVEVDTGNPEFRVRARRGYRYGPESEGE